MHGNQYQIQVNGLGSADILTISQAHRALGLSQKELVQRILTAPSVLQSGLEYTQAQRIYSALSEYNLPCEVTCNKDLVPGQQSYEVACYISDFSKITKLAAELATFLGQSSQEVIKTLSQVPAILIGRVSHKVAQDITERFQASGIEFIISDTIKATYTVVAFMLDYNEAVKSQYLTLGLKPATSARDCRQWSATNLTLNQAQLIWQKASELHLPVSIQNHDYLRFDLSLTAISEHCDRTVLSALLSQAFKIPMKVHEKIFQQPGIVLTKCVSMSVVQEQLKSLQALGCQAEAIATQGMRFNIQLPYIDVRSKNTDLAMLISTIMGRQVNIPSNTLSTTVLNLSANIHQAAWIAYEAKRAGIKAKLLKLTDQGLSHAAS